MNANSGSDSDESLFGSTSAPPQKKRRKLNDSPTNNGQISNPSATSASPKESNSSTIDPVLLEHAKSRLSKFAARLFDPNRIKVRVESIANNRMLQCKSGFHQSKKVRKILTIVLVFLFCIIGVGRSANDDTSER